MPLAILDSSRNEPLQNVRCKFVRMYGIKFALRNRIPISSRFISNFGHSVKFVHWEQQQESSIAQIVTDKYFHRLLEESPLSSTSSSVASGAGNPLLEGIIGYPF